MADSDSRRYLLIFQLADSTPQRLQIAIPRIQGAIKRLSAAGTEQLFRSAAGDVFGYLIRARADMNASQIGAALESPGPTFGTTIEPILDGRDRVTVIEIGADYAGRGIGRAASWLQHH